MVGGLIGAGLSAIFYGVGSVLQAIAARREGPAEGGGAGVLLRTMRQLPFLAGLALDTAGFLAQVWALQTLPIFVVQSALAATLAVTAVVAVPLLGLRLNGRQWAAVAGVCAGLVLLGLSAGAERPRVPAVSFQFWLLAAVAVLAFAGVLVDRLPGSAPRWLRPAGLASSLALAGRGVALGLVAGLTFGVVAIAARSLGEPEVLRLLRQPATYVIVVAGVVAFIFYTIGLQRAAVTTVTAGLVVGETVLPSVVGVLVFDDGTRPGFLLVALAGFALAITGSLALARFGDVG